MHHEQPEGAERGGAAVLAHQQAKVLAAGSGYTDAKQPAPCGESNQTVGTIEESGIDAHVGRASRGRSGGASLARREAKPTERVRYAFLCPGSRPDTRRSKEMTDSIGTRAWARRGGFVAVIVAGLVPALPAAAGGILLY